MKIKLTDEQIDQLVQAKTAQLQKVFEGEVSKAKKTFEDAVKLLKNKYQYTTIQLEEDEPEVSKGKYDEDIAITMLTEGKKNKEVAAALGVTEGYISIKKGELVKAGKLKGKPKKKK